MNVNEQARPNILIIQPDQHRADVMGCSGNKLAITPNLDKLAVAGVRFSHAASASPVCCPFRATLQTGLYIHEHGVVQNGIQLKHEFKTIGEIFSENGYATGYIGKWHLEGFLPDDTVEQRFLVTGPRVAGQVVVDSGLAADERIIVEGMHRVRHGQKVSALSRQEYEAQKAHRKAEELKAADEQGDDS